MASIDLLMPELEKRGHVWPEYPQPGPTPSNWPSTLKTTGGISGFGEDEQLGLTAREKLYGPGQRRLQSDHYGSKFQWHAGKEPPQLE
jgi:hypothetical protein